MVGERRGNSEVLVRKKVASECGKDDGAVPIRGQSSSKEERR